MMSTKIFLTQTNSKNHCAKQIEVLNKHDLIYCSTDLYLKRGANGKLAKESVYNTYIDKNGKENYQPAPKFKDIQVRKEYNERKNGALVFTGKRYNNLICI